MKVAILIQCHKNPGQINRLLKVMEHRDVEFFLHIDLKSTMEKDIAKRKDVHILPKRLRVKVAWGGYSQVEATLHLLRYAKGYGIYDFFWLISGQDFPLKPIEEALGFLEAHRQYNFVGLAKSSHYGIGHENNLDKRNTVYVPSWMVKRRSIPFILIKRLYIEITGGYNRTFPIFRRKNETGLDFYFGSSWNCLNREAVSWILDYLSNHKEYESFFQTLIMNSPFKERRMDILTYIDWSEGKNSPKTLTTEDFHDMTESGFYLARKLDEGIDRELIGLLENYIGEMQREHGGWKKENT